VPDVPLAVPVSADDAGESTGEDAPSCS
jgi:hypothetical protein